MILKVFLAAVEGASLLEAEMSVDPLELVLVFVADFKVNSQLRSECAL